jgi:CheY-like chemotaxis protein
MVDDSVGFLAGMEALLAQISKGDKSDIRYVGGHTRNSPDLFQRVYEAQANVVLVDIGLREGVDVKRALRHSETSGFAAIRALRQSSGPALRIIAYTMHPDLREEARRHGADAFLSKASTVPEILAAIRGDDVVGPYHLGRLTGLELFVRHREFVLHGTSRSTELIDLDTASFALLHYLACERQQNMQGWAIRDRGRLRGQGDPRYQMTALETWKNVNKDCGGMFQSDQDEYIRTEKIAPWATKINAAVRPWHDQGRTIVLIQVPSDQACYTLVSDITSDGIRIHPQAQGESTS